MTNKKGITLRVGGPRKTVTTEEAEQIKTRWEKEISDDAIVQVLDLSCRQWTADSVKVIRPVVEKIASTLLVVDIQDTIAGLETSLGFEVMELFTEMLSSANQVIEINMNDNATGPRVLQRIAPLLGSTNVKKVYFNNCGLSAETMPQLDEALTISGGAGAGAGAGMARLEVMHLNKNMIGPEGAKFVAEQLPKCTQLIDFSYCGCRPTKSGTQYIAQGLKNLAEMNDTDGIALEQLKLEDCDFSGDDGEFPTLTDLAKALEKLSKLTTLNLRDAGDLEETGAGIVSQALVASNCKLIDLDLSGCCFGEDGAESIAELIGKNLGSLKVLKLETNEFGNDGLEKILSAFKGGDNCCLERLHLDENELDDGSIDLLLDAASNLPKLRVLSLKDNMDLEEADDDKKEELRNKFANAIVMIADDDEEPDVKEDPDAGVDALAEELANL